MDFPIPGQLTEHRVLRVLVGGFALVVIFLGVAGFVAIRGTRAIEEDASKVVREQLVMARLFNEVQAEQETLAAVLHQLTHVPDSIDREKLLNNLEDADLALTGIAQSVSDTPEPERWQRLVRTTRDFSSEVREALHDENGIPTDALALLFDRHDIVIDVEQDLLDSSEQRVTQIEKRIEQQTRQLADSSRLLLGICLGLALVCAGLTVKFAGNSIRRMEWQANELSRVSWHMLQDQESAARRFSHELHDELGQSLAAVKANLTSTSPQDWGARRLDCVQLVDDAIANVRELSQLLRPVILDDFGLDAGLRWQVERFGDRTGIRTNYISTMHERPPDEIETHLFRITQEALTNVARHSGANMVTVELHGARGRLHLSIEDNGRWPNSATPNKEPSLGMTGMRARAAQAGGKLELSTAPGGGLRIEVDVPWIHQIEEHAEHKDAHSLS